ncbi:MAG: histidine triad nucleotide-binding protein [Candidatus Nealsonbacteria bacterium CG23_combo_of_CG06-09_8_20_14_all_39_25]|uniref:Histidine triad nucleotide-binding protein n=4 Tax=Candidatus Nealsoniibacteriota TaxID=1817911 RepID=A0A2G9YTA8_9BACT|nr:MAG: histidine triad nucleotide-binding protein [Candidatus Nealsonbacteria bacterium CG23_combo_of_CG06-09_8_20_14_all_39_25]PIQ98275.1 MAG: histidine triad nucleotide-binding protein [Candidatus Nealsonbacteria bacterium CG11_big_fil_rev_8_21_14_0_20_39_9]PIW90183.1 MAG: histidine triad nucleotide-binding protein [Candidatus Nealsonbacteria bacterium CG_4_8_14_3_um_filter_40_11]PIZ87987.1 MAG: histidine triad nucleotide-binding protein [Candidatus Nealsonbacteria bacterium CG_4_10_14_0_2_um
MDCIFCKIANKEIPSEIVYETDAILVFKDTKPVAPVHLLLIPKKHIPSVNHLTAEDKNLIGELFLVAQKVAREQGVAETGYRLVFNIGKDAGQTIDHLHLHLIGGERLPWA